MIWYDTIVMLANNDITKIDAITDMNAIMVLNHLNYLKQKAKWEKDYKKY